MTTVFLCDDNRQTIKKYSDWMRRTAEQHQIDLSLSVFHSGESLLFHLCDFPDIPDILYLDVLMDKLNGIDTAKKLRELGCNAEIVFLTTSEDHVFDCFEVHPVYYLLKHQTTEEKFRQVFLQAVHLSNHKTSSKFVCKSGGVQKVIPISEISHFSIWRGVMTVHYGKGKTFEYRNTMEKLEASLPGKDFVRTHRSYLVHLPYIAMFQQQNLLLVTGDTVPIGGTYMEPVKKTFSAYASRFHMQHSQSRENHQEEN